MTVNGKTAVPKLGGIISEKRDRISFLFYVIMISLQFAMSLIGNELPLLFRLSVLVLLFLSLVRNPKWLPFVLAVFWGTSMMSPLPILPTETYYISIFTIAIWLLNFANSGRRIKPFIFVLVFYFLMIAFVTIEPFLDYTSPLFLIIPIVLAASSFVKNEDDILRLLFALILMSLFLASIFLLRRGDFAVAYKTLDVDRSGWTNANMFGGSLAVGFICSIGYFLGSFRLNKNIFLNLVAITTSFVTLTALILNASRGSLLAALGTGIILLLFSKVKLPYKIIVTVVIVGFAIYLYNSGYFNLIEARMGEEDLETIVTITLKSNGAQYQVKLKVVGYGVWDGDDEYYDEDI